MKTKIFFVSVISLYFMFAIFMLASAETTAYYIYDNKTEAYPIYKTVSETITKSCTSNITAQLIDCSEVHYSQVFDRMTTKTVSSKIIGVNKDGRDLIGYYVIDKNIVSSFKYPIGDRHIGCRQYEIDKGICEEMR